MVDVAWRGFKVLRDPMFVQKLDDIVGLDMSPPEHAKQRGLGPAKQTDRVTHI